MYARGAIVGITRGTTLNHIIRAAEESIAYQSADLWLMAMVEIRPFRLRQMVSPVFISKKQPVP